MPETATQLPGQLRAAAGPGRVLVLGYAFFTLAAGARSGVQLTTHASRAPLAYALSGLAALIYLAGTVALARADRRPGHARFALLLCRIELAGVLLVGVASLLRPAAFPDATVWSLFGSGYGFVPLALPILALAWIHRLGSAPQQAPSPAAEAGQVPFRRSRSWPPTGAGPWPHRRSGSVRRR